MLIEQHIKDWGDALKRAVAHGRDCEPDLANMMQYSEMTPALTEEVAMFRRALDKNHRMASDEAALVVMRLVHAAIEAGPNARARALHLD
jgi:hypothetical protein